MKKLILLIALALPALLTAQQRDWANYGRYAEANAQLTTPPAVV
ncbi:MAG TPA: acylhydrolase, partial [Alistipes sp.]|nr:acylhydrolase [Alistipes sp.]